MFISSAAKKNFCVYRRENYVCWKAHKRCLCITLKENLSINPSMVGFYHLFVLFLISNKISFAPEVKRIHETTLCVLFVPKANNLWPNFGYLFQFIPVNVSVLGHVFFGPYQSKGKWVSIKHINICWDSDFVVCLVLFIVTVVVIGHLGISSNPASVPVDGRVLGPVLSFTIHKNVYENEGFDFQLNLQHICGRAILLVVSCC